MLYKLRSRLTYANVMATAAVFIALGGTSVATHEMIFSDDIVDGQVMRQDLATGAVANTKILDGGIATSKLQGNSVTTSRIAPGAVTSGRLAANAVTASKISDGSLGTTEFSSSIPAAHVTHSVDQSIADSTNTPLAFDTERYDTASMHDNSTDNTRLTAPVTGVYGITATVHFPADGFGIRTVHLRKNATTQISIDTRGPLPSGGEFTMGASTIARLEAGDYVEVVINQTSGGALNVEKRSEWSPEFAMNWLAPGP